MHFIAAGNIPSKARCLACLLVFTGCAHAVTPQTTPQATVNLPDLSSPSEANVGHFGLDGKSVKLDYATRERKWNARVDEYLHFDRSSVTLDYGTLLTNDLGAGAALHQRSDYSDLWVNGVYAPVRDFRLRVSGGQLRMNDNAAGAGGTPGMVQQNSYLLGAKRTWHDGPLSSVGMTAYAIEASDTGAASGATRISSFGSEESDAQTLADGYQQGHALNLSLRPTAQSKIDLGRERNRLTYYSTSGTRGDRDVVANRIRFSQYFDNCMRLQGGYSANDESNRLDLSLGRDRWHISVARMQAINSNDTTVGIGYSLPLGRSPNDATRCALQPKEEHTFMPMIDTAVSRPEHFPRDALRIPGMPE